VSVVSLQEIEDAIPPEGFFKGKEWLLSPEPFSLSQDTFEQLISLGETLSQFLKACDNLYLSSKSGGAPKWISELLDLGKPREVVEMGVHSRAHGDYARVIRPDILLTEHGLSLTEIDSTPGGIGLTAWLNQLYADAGWNVVGGSRGMIDGFKGTLDGGRVIFSREALDYRPEMEWIVSRIDPNWRNKDLIVNEWELDKKRHASNNFYRYFELWDLQNVSNVDLLKGLLESGASTFTAPMKAFLEEKLWLALLWTPGLRDEWIARLGEETFERMKSIVPQGWVLDPSPIPYNSVYPGLDIQNWNELEGFSQKERQLVIKISGFSEKAWGSRGVTIGHDISSTEWKSVVDESLTDFSSNPRIMQRFHQSAVFRHPYHDRERGEIWTMEGRVRLCPYYFRVNGTVTLGGVLATICPKEKKIIHGMKDAIMVPCIARS